MTDAGFDIFDRTLPLDRIATEAKQVNFRRSALVVLAAVLVAVGFTAAKVLRAVISTIAAALIAGGYLAAKTVTACRAGNAWCVAAVLVGWRAGYDKTAARETRTAA